MLKTISEDPGVSLVTFQDKMEFSSAGCRTNEILTTASYYNSE